MNLTPNYRKIGILGYGNGFGKSEFYYVFDNIEQGIPTTRDKVKNSRKRRFVAHMFSPKSIVEFESYMTTALENLGRQMKPLILTKYSGKYVELGQTSQEIAVRLKPDEAALDAAQWPFFLAFNNWRLGKMR